MNDTKEYITGTAEKGTYNISSEVVATVAANAACEVEGVAGISVGGKEIANIKNNKKNALRGVKINYEENSLSIDVNVVVNIGAEIGPVAEKIQTAVIDAVEATIGQKVSAVNVRVNGLNLGK